MRVATSDNKSNFLSTIRRTRISEEKNRKFVEYEIACQYRLISTKTTKEVVYQWSVWKRFSEFEKCNTSLRQTLGWQMDGIDFPSAHTFVINKLSPEFIAQRQNELKDYWQRIVSIEKVCEFQKHHCSQVLKVFLEIDSTIKREVNDVADMVTDEEKDDSFTSGAVTISNGMGAGRRGPTKSLSNKRLSLRASYSNSSNNMSNPDANKNSTRPTSLPLNIQRSSIEPEVSRPLPPPPPPPRFAISTVVNESKSSAQTKSGSLSNPQLPSPPQTQLQPAAIPLTLPPSNISSVTPTATSSSSAPLPPKPTGARADLLSAICARRKD